MTMNQGSFWCLWLPNINEFMTSRNRGVIFMSVAQKNSSLGGYRLFSQPIYFVAWQLFVTFLSYNGNSDLKIS